MKRKAKHRSVREASWIYGGLNTLITSLAHPLNALEPMANMIVGNERHIIRDCLRANPDIKKLVDAWDTGPRNPDRLRVLIDALVAARDKLADKLGLPPVPMTSVAYCPYCGVPLVVDLEVCKE